MKPITMHSEARAEALRAMNDYESQREGLGREFRQEFEAAVNKIRENPFSYAAEDRKGRRRCPLKRFPYHLVYVDLGTQIWIVALSHHHRSPRYWARRRQE